MRPPYFEGIALPAVSQQQPQQQQPRMIPQQQQQDVTASPVRTAPTVSPQQIQPLSPTPSTALTVSNPNDAYAMSPAEQSRYSLLFPAYAAPDNANDTNNNNTNNNSNQRLYVHGPAAVQLFSKSGLDNPSLKHVWTLSDSPVDNKLDEVEFCIAMHLIVCVTKKGLGMPEILPGSLRGLLERRRGAVHAPQQQQMQQQFGGISENGTGGQSVSGVPSQQVAAPTSPEGIPSPDKMGMMYNNSGQGAIGGGGSLPPPPVYGMQQHQQYQQQMGQMTGAGPGGQPMMMGQQGNNNASVTYPQMGVPQPEQQFQQLPGNVQQQPVDDAFAGLSNSPVDDVEEYSTVGGGSSAVHQAPSGVSVMGGGMTNHDSVVDNGTFQTNPNGGGTHPPIPQPPTPSRVTAQHNSHFAPTSPYASSKPKLHEPTSPAPTVTSQRTANNANQHLYSPSSSRKIKPDGEVINAELEKLRSAHQKLQAECVSLRAKANLVSEEEREAQAEIRELASGIAELSEELGGLKDEVAEVKGRLKDSLGVLKAQKEKKE